MDLVLFLEQRANSIHPAPVDRIEELRGAKLIEHIFERQLPERRIFLRARGAPSRRKGEDGQLRVEGPEDEVNLFPQLTGPEKKDDLIDLVQAGLLVSSFLGEIAPLAAAAAASDAPGGFGLLNQEEHLAPLGRDLAHELKKQIVFADGEVFHDLMPPRGATKTPNGNL